ncbi:hypothetical protein Ancab_025615 [Ancistrocladus abbreviatus]
MDFKSHLLVSGALARTKGEIEKGNKGAACNGNGSGSATGAVCGWWQWESILFIKAGKGWASHVTIKDHDNIMSGRYDWVNRLAGYISPIRNINPTEASICVLASQLANLGESIIGASLQGKEGFRWLNNDAVNIINISMGSILAVMMQQILLNSMQR